MKLAANAPWPAARATLRYAHDYFFDALPYIAF